MGCLTTLLFFSSVPGSLRNLSALEEQRSGVRKQLSGFRSVEVGRVTILKDLVALYQEYPELCFQEIWVVFRGESGVDTGGLTRELFSVFWTAVEGVYFDGMLRRCQY